MLTLILIFFSSSTSSPSCSSPSSISSSHISQMKYTAPARNGQIGPRPIKPSMLFEFDYRPKISSLLPHESHKEISAHLNIAWKSIGQDILQLYKGIVRCMIDE